MPFEKVKKNLMAFLKTQQKILILNSFLTTTVKLIFIYFQYDLSASQFSPDGRVFQVEYAQKAVENSG